MADLKLLFDKNKKYKEEEEKYLFQIKTKAMKHFSHFLTVPNAKVNAIQINDKNELVIDLEVRKLMYHQLKDFIEDILPENHEAEIKYDGNLKICIRKN